MYATVMSPSKAKRSSAWRRSALSWGLLFHLCARATAHWPRHDWQSDRTVLLIFPGIHLASVLEVSR